MPLSFSSEEFYPSLTRAVSQVAYEYSSFGCLRGNPPVTYKPDNGRCRYSSDCKLLGRSGTPISAKPNLGS